MPASLPTRRTAVKAAVAAFAAPFFNRHRYALEAQSAQEYSERAVRLVRESLVIDMLNQFLYRRDMQAKLREWFSRPGAFTQSDFERFRVHGNPCGQLWRGSRQLRIWPDALRPVEQLPGGLSGLAPAHQYGRRFYARENIGTLRNPLRDAKLDPLPGSR